ncbi:A-kinase anchor protein 12 isoform 2-T2 [Thomomys bottae]
MPWWTNFCFGQRDSEDVRERDSEKEMATNSEVTNTTKDGQEEIPEIIEEIPSSASNLDEIAHSTESQTNDVGFKKVFKFVGFKFTVKKDKTEKPDTVQLVTVQKEEAEGAEESHGAGDHQEASVETEGSSSKESELKQSTEKLKDPPKQEQNNTEISTRAESDRAVEEGNKEEEKQEKEPTKSLESPTSPINNETASPLKKFFTQGWAGWRKKASFRKPKEDELEAFEKKKEQEPGKTDIEEGENMEGINEPPTAPEQCPAQESTEGGDQTRLSAEYEKVELPSEHQGPAEEKRAPLATEVFAENVEGHQEVVAEIHTSDMEKTTEEQEADVEETVQSSAPEKQGEVNAEAAGAGPTVDVLEEGDHPSPGDLAPEDKVLSKYPEGIASEAELLSSQERIKMQASPLKKLFTSSGLKKLSGKKQKGKRGGGGDEELGDHAMPTESPESADEQKGDSSASSPEEHEEPMGLEKGLGDGPQEGDGEEGATSDGEKKREGITPWASFKKMVTPKKRVRRPSESDKEDELDKIKSATLSSTESAASEVQEETRAAGEEPRRKVDTSVSWEALICVGSSKKRARKASSSDEEGDPKTAGDKAEETASDKEPATDPGLAHSLEQDPGPGSSSPEPAGSPSEGEGVSTWESFKRLVTPRKKSKCKLEEKTSEEAGVEASTSDLEPGREESWVSIKKFIPGRRKKRPDGKREAGPGEAAGPADANEEDGDVPAVVPLSEYEAVEREKLEAQRAPEPGVQVALYVSEEVSRSLVHPVTAVVVDGARAVASLEERAPSWISASVAQPPGHVEDEARPVPPKEEEEEDKEDGEGVEEEMEGTVEAAETPGAAQTWPESRDPGQDAEFTSRDPGEEDVEFTSEAVTAAETTEAPEPSGAEETADMVSAVSQLTGSPHTTEEATPVPEVEGAAPDPREQEKRTQAVLQAVAEKVREESEPADTRGPKDRAQSGQEAEEEEAHREGKVCAPAAVPAVPTLASEASPQEAEKPQEAPAGSAEAVAPAELAEVLGSPADTAPGSYTQAQATQVETIPAQQDAPPAPGCQSPEDQEKPAEAELVPDQTEPELLVGAGPVVSKTQVVPEVDRTPDEEAQQDGPGEGHVVSTRTEEGAESPGEAAAEAGCQLQTPSLEEREAAAQRGDAESREAPPPLQVPEELEPEAAAPKSEELISTEDLPETSSPDGSPAPSQTHKEVSHGEVQVEGPGASTALTAVAEEEEEEEEEEKKVEENEEEKVDEEEKEEEEKKEEEKKEEEKEEEEVEVVEEKVEQMEEEKVDEEEVVEETKISKAGETSASSDASLVPAEKSCERDQVQAPLLEGNDISAEPETQAEPTPVLSTSHEKGREREGSVSQTLQLGAGDEQEDKASMSHQEDLKAALETESSKIIRNVIQTAVDQFTQEEEETSVADSQTQATPEQANNQEAGEKPGEAGGREQALVQNETQTLAAHDTLTVGPALSEDVSEMAPKILIPVESSGVGGQPLEEGIPPSEADGDGSRAKAGPDEGLHELRERIEKPPSEPKENKKGDAHLESQISAPAGAELSGGLTKESPDTNGPKVTEEEPAQEIGFQEGKGCSEADKEIRSPKEEEMQKPERESAKSELTEC